MELLQSGRYNLYKVKDKSQKKKKERERYQGSEEGRKPSDMWQVPFNGVP